MSPDVSFLTMRSDPQMRSTFLADLAQRNRPKIRSIMHEVRRAIFDVDDAVQEFLIGANRAIDSAITEDDGRGNNDPEAWCAWRGIMAVKEVMRKTQGRKERACYKQRAENRMIYTGALSEIVNENEAGSLYYADPNDYADEACANVDFEHILCALRWIDREAALLLVRGTLVCRCGSAPHSYIADIAKALGRAETRVFKILRRIRDAFRRTERAA